MCSTLPMFCSFDPHNLTAVCCQRLGIEHKFRAREFKGNGRTRHSGSASGVFHRGRFVLGLPLADQSAAAT